MYLLNTNVVSETRRTRPHGGVMAWLAAAQDDGLYVSAVTLGELQAGVELAREENAEKAAEIEAWIDQLASKLEVLPMDEKSFRLWARLMHGRSHDQSIDTMIAATALVHGLQLVTRNVKDFQRFDLKIINPFTSR